MGSCRFQPCPSPHHLSHFSALRGRNGTQPGAVTACNTRGNALLDHPRQVAGEIWRSRVVAPQRGRYGVRAINPLSVISPKIEPRGWNRSGLSPVLPLIFLMGTHTLHRKATKKQAYLGPFFGSPMRHGYGLPRKSVIEPNSRSRGSSTVPRNPPCS